MVCRENTTRSNRSGVPRLLGALAAASALIAARASAQTLALPLTDAAADPPADRDATPSADASPSADATWGKSTHTNAVPIEESKRPPSSEFTTKSADIVAVEAYNSTYLPLFQRAMLPGPAGSIVSPQTNLPIYDYMMFRVVDADMPWAKNSVDMELSLWGAGSLTGNIEPQRTYDGDVSVASITQRYKLAYVKLGRQYITEGAARFAHVDGVSAGVRSKLGLALSGYAGWTVLPRWDARPNYQHFGATSDALVTSADQLPRSDRSGNWMMGSRVGYSANRVGEVGLSIHEQREDHALGRRDAALDLHFYPIESVDASGRALVDLDSRGLADAFLGVSYHPIRELDIAAEYRRMIPTLLMSRQSVLSVFAVNRFDEGGGELRYHLSPRVVLFGGTFVEWLQDEGMGYRARGGAKIYPDDDHRLLVQFAYTRVHEPENGYHGTRVSAVYRLTVPVTVTAEQYTYLYDIAIRGMRTSSVQALTASWRFKSQWELMLGSSLFHSPYAAVDAQSMLRLAYTYGSALGGEP
jgi:hypothetical protein